jgi:sugar (pentulose or hexulose) kinase
VCGGGSNSDLFMQIVADVFGVTAVRNVVNGAAALGAAISAAVATGFYETYEDAVAAMVHEKDAFASDPDTHEMYTRINERAYKNLTANLEDTLKTIHEAYDGE